MMNNRRNSLISKIHYKASRLLVCLNCDEIFIGGTCPKCGSTEFRHSDKLDYRFFLKRITGKTSCGDMCEDELAKVHKAIYAAGWKDFIFNDNRRKSQGYILSEAQRVLGDAYKQRVEAFSLSTIGKSFWRLDHKQMRKVIGWIHRLEKYGAKEGQG